MNTKNSIKGAATTLAVLGLLLTGCASTPEPTDPGTGNGDAALSGAVVIDGSSTVAPNTEVAAELFGDLHPGVNVSVGVSGTGGGFEKFCNGETDISEASRNIKDDEAEACAANGIDFVECRR